MAPFTVDNSRYSRSRATVATRIDVVPGCLDVKVAKTRTVTPAEALFSTARTLPVSAHSKIISVVAVPYIIVLVTAPSDIEIVVAPSAVAPAVVLVDVALTVAPPEFVPTAASSDVEPTILSTALLPAVLILLTFLSTPLALSASISWWPEHPLLHSLQVLLHCTFVVVWPVASLRIRTSRIALSRELLKSSI